MIAHINTKNPSIFKSQNGERKSLFHKTSYKQENFKRCKITVVTKTLNVKQKQKNRNFFHFKVEKASTPSDFSQ